MVDRPIAWGSAKVQYSSRSVAGCHSAFAADVRDGRNAHVDQRDLVRLAGPDVQRLTPVGDLAGGDAAGGEQRGGGAGDRRLPHLREGVVGVPVDRTGSGGMRLCRPPRPGRCRRRRARRSPRHRAARMARTRAWVSSAVPESTSSSTNSSAGEAPVARPALGQSAGPRRPRRPCRRWRRAPAPPRRRPQRRAAAAPCWSSRRWGTPRPARRDGGCRGRTWGWRRCRPSSPGPPAAPPS